MFNPPPSVRMLRWASVRGLGALLRDLKRSEAEGKTSVHERKTSYPIPAKSEFTEQQAPRNAREAAGNRARDQASNQPTNQATKQNKIFAGMT